MAQRRMFSKDITNSSEFLMMPQSSQNLYFHFGMNADDDGFCEVFTIMRMTESKPDDLNTLHTRGFVYIIDGKVCIVKNWHENNQLRVDRYKKSKYLEDPKYSEIYFSIMDEKIKELEVYKKLLPENSESFDKKVENQVQKSGLATKWQPNGNQMVTQYSIGKGSIGKVRLGKDSKDKDISKDISKEKSFDKIVKSSFGNKDINTLLQEFEKSFGFAPKPVQQNRWAANRLIKAHGLEWVLSVLKAAVVIQDEPYSPKIYSLIDLEKKLPNIAGFYKRKKIKGGIRL